MLTTVAKRIQSSLKRKGVIATSGEIKDYLRSNAANIENITKQEETSTTEYFLCNTSQLTVASEDVEGLATNEAAPDQDALVNSLDSEDVDTVYNVDNQEEEVIAPTTKQETSICVDVENGNIQPTITEETETLPQSSELATTTKNELVASTAVNLGIELSTQDIENIADNFDAGSDDFTQTLEQVKGAIIAYVQHKIASNNQKIVNTINEISQVASDGFEENSQTLTNGLKQLNQQLVQQSTDFKSKLAGTLSRFKLPEAS
ncbi:hypothetical protein [Richelia sinica]|uniref:hypothetical protein n=1 Tax=Richelia sinica TaxID=1357545 RepID=UPI0016887AE0|nr:hypothetical protein [Richelia sinica]MBD2667264.1 hypothetical protein [Richelia sinica FACHB-800]